MSWQTGGRVHVIKDVQIPANTKGWAVYLDGVTVYMPAKCGNLSVLHTPTKRVAAVKAATAPAPPVAEAPPPAAPPPEAAPPVAFAPAEFPTPTPLSAIPPPPPVHHSILSFLPLLAIIPLALIGAHTAAPGFLPAGPIGGIAGAPVLAPPILTPIISAPVAPIIAPIVAPPPSSGGSPPGGGGGMCCGCGCD
jgi:hypothetical protein